MKRTKFHQIYQSTTIPTVLVGTPVHVRIQMRKKKKRERKMQPSLKILFRVRMDVRGVCISDLCLNIKKANLKLAERTDSAQLSDIRLLALNDLHI